MFIRVVRAAIQPSLVLSLILGFSLPIAHADFTITGAFGPNGDLGFVNSPQGLSVTFGATGQGSINQLDAFVNVSGQNLTNDGSGFGTSADLSYGPPPGLTYNFSAQLLDAHKLILTYQFINQTGATLPGFQFLSYIDADIGTNTADETALVTGAPSPGLPNRGPTSYQVGDPTSSTLFSNEKFGTFDQTNGMPPGQPGDVAMGVGFSVGNVLAGNLVRFQIMLSDDQTSIGTFNITQNDPTFTRDSLTYSGQVLSVPEPGAWLLMVVGAVILISVSGTWRK